VEREDLGLVGFTIRSSEDVIAIHLFPRIASLEELRISTLTRKTYRGAVLGKK
jgi:hypothetical protein